MYYMSQADQQVWRVAKLIKDGVPFLEAMSAESVQWSEAQFGRNVARILTNEAYKKSLGAAARATLSQAVRVVGGEAVVAAGPALMAAASTGMLILGGLLIIGAIVAGAWMYANWGKPSSEPVQAGPAMNRNPPVMVNAPVSSAADEKFAVWIIYISGETLYIGQESTLKSRPACQYPGGGLCGEGENPPPSYSKLEGDFDTYDEAHAAYCRATGGAAPQPMPLTGDSKINAYGHSLWTTGISCP